MESTATLNFEALGAVSPVTVSVTLVRETWCRVAFMLEGEEGLRVRRATAGLPWEWCERMPAMAVPWGGFEMVLDWVGGIQI